MSNVVPPASERAHMRITTDKAAKVWRDGCAALCQKHSHYQTRIHAKGIKGGVPSGQPNHMHILAAAGKCGYASVTDDNVAQVLADVAARASELYPDVLPGQMSFSEAQGR